MIKRIVKKRRDRERDDRVRVKNKRREWQIEIKNN